MGGRGGSSHQRTVGFDLRRMTATSQVADWIKQQRWFTPNASVHLDGVDVAAVREIALAFQQVFQRYPQLIGAFDGVKSFDLGANVYADCNLATDQIRVSVSMYRDAKALSRHYASDIRANWHPVGTDWPPLLPMRLDTRWTDTLHRNFIRATGRCIGIGIGTPRHCKRKLRINLRLSRRRSGSVGRYRDMELPIQRNGLLNHLPRVCAPVRHAAWLRN